MALGVGLLRKFYLVSILRRGIKEKYEILLAMKVTSRYKRDRNRILHLPKMTKTVTRRTDDRLGFALSFLN